MVFVFIFSACWMFSLTLFGSYKTKRNQSENKKEMEQNKKLNSFALTWQLIRAIEIVVKLGVGGGEWAY